MPDLNSEVKLIKAAELFSLTHDIFENGGHVWITVTGMSMSPFFKGKQRQCGAIQGHF